MTDAPPLHADVLALVALVQRFLPVHLDLLEACSLNLRDMFADGAPGPRDHCKVLFLAHRLLRDDQPLDNDAARCLLCFDTETLAWSSQLNAALRDDPIRVLHQVTDRLDRVELYFVLGDACQARLESIIGADPHQADLINDPDADGTNNFEREDRGEDLGFRSIDILDAVNTLARHVDTLLVECNSPRRLYHVGSWGSNYSNPRWDMFWLAEPALAAAFAARGHRFEPAAEVFDRGTMMLDWEYDEHYAEGG